jgi:DNA-directed RNA polymerase subunit RPC12/RpoP
MISREPARRARGPTPMMRLFVVVSLALSAASPALAQSKRPPRVECGCPTARILGRGPISLDGGASVSAWLHDGASLLPFRRNPDKPQQLDPIEAPLSMTQAPGSDSLGPSTSSFVKVSATGPLEDGIYLGVLRKNDTAPRDTVAIKASAPGAPTDPKAPDVAALWLAPLEERERPGCGAWLTHMIAFELREGSAPVEAFLVTDSASGAKALVDARAAGVFGVGRVEVCEQGLPLRAAPVALEVRPVSASFGVGEPWTFTSDGTGQTDPVRGGMPANADRDRAEDPFPIPGKDEGGGVTRKELAILVMGTVGGGAAFIAFVMFVLIPMRKRKMVDIKCPSCGSAVPVDALDPKTDGFFCPSCGSAGFWKEGAAVSATDLKSEPTKEPTKPV